jgi:hypothetical protein
VEGDQLLIRLPANPKDDKNVNQPHTDEYREQEDYLHSKEKYNKDLIKHINSKIENQSDIKLTGKYCNRH